MLGSSSSSSSSSQEQATAVVGGSGGGGGTSPLQQNNGSNRSNTTNSWIRGVNLGGWLVLERYIVPYQFAVTDCHLRGDFCWYPGAASAPPETDPNYRPCDANKCRPAKIAGALGGRPDYPVDEATLAQIFLRANDNSTTAAERWFNYHFDNFIGREDLAALRRAGVTHVRVPLPHWILGTAAEDDEERDKWIVGDRWRYFVRACRWAREIGLQVWPDIHTAPGSQNGFDNSGQALPYMTCRVWSNWPEHVQRSLKAIRDIATAVKEEGIDDVVTGLGLLNEPFADCDLAVYHNFLEQGLDAVRGILGEDTAVYVSDMFQETDFNDGRWWLDPERYHGTYLDSHYYQCFDHSVRRLSPRQHVALTCENHRRRVEMCCWDDPPRNSRPSRGVSRMMGEWSAAFDTLPAAMISEIMQGIEWTGKAPHFDRTLSPERQEFLSNFVQAQVVAFEDAEAGVSRAWFYWTAKMEGGAFAEWDFLRGVKEGWIPVMPPPDQPAEREFGTCHDILFRTADDMSIVHEYPDPTKGGKVTSDHEMVIDDDVVLSHGESLWNDDWDRGGHGPHRWIRRHGFVTTLIVVLMALSMVVWRLRKMRRCSGSRRRRAEYTKIGDVDHEDALTVTSDSDRFSSNQSLAELSLANGAPTLRV